MVEKAKVEVFTSVTCPYCPKAVEVAKEVSKERDDIKVIETSTATKAGQKRARRFNVRTVPTVFISSPVYPDRIGHAGAPSKDKLNKMVNIVLGLEEWNQKESIFSRLTKKFKIKI